MTWIGVTGAPAFLGLLFIIILGRWVEPRYLAAFAMGVFFWFFVDTIEGSAKLDVSSGFGGGLPQIALVSLFVLGAIAFFYADRRTFSFDPKASDLTYIVPLLAAFAIGVHGFGEGAAAGSLAALTQSNTIIGPGGAFGDLNSGLGYSLHKVFEPMMAGALYFAFSRGRAYARQEWFRNIVALTALFAVPSFVGLVTGYFISYDATYFFALGTGTSIYAMLWLAKCMLRSDGVVPKYDSLWLSMSLIVGFILIYLSALLHS